MSDTALHRRTTQRRAPAGFRAAMRLVSDNWTAGSLTIAHPSGPDIELRGDAAGPAARLIVRDYRFMRRVLSRGVMGFGEGFMAGEWDTPDLSTLLLAFSHNLDRIQNVLNGKPIVRWALTLLHALNANTRAGARRNIEAHYDLGNDFYGLWLDPSMTYSAARYDGAADVADAQRNKYAALARLIGLEPSHRVLEIGCGWGGFAEFAAKEVGAKVTGVTISPSQLAFARERIAREGLNEKVELKLIDYRDVGGTFDRIASIEMFEAVGERYWPAYFGKVRDLLRPGGVAGLQIITIRDDLFDGYRRQADFIQRYIFPGGMLPSEPRLIEEMSRAGLAVRTVERFAADYGRTLRDWRDAFERAGQKVSALGFDARFQRMWRFYLAYCEAGFRTERTNVGQWAVGRG
jgi:cyclopropane-fatty-acyl-phospholipid synthase